MIFWLAGQNDDKLRVQIGFGDGFATCEPIDKQRENNFEIPVVIDKNGKKIELKRTSENYKFEGEKQPEGVYIITGQYKQTDLLDRGQKRQMAYGRHERYDQRR